MKPQVNINVNITVDNLSQFEQAIILLERKQILAGVPEAKARRKGDPINNATLAAIHDKGSPSQNIPARPFMEPGIKSVGTKIEQKLLSAGQAVLEGDSNKAAQRLEETGLIAQNGLRAMVNSNIQPPLKPATLAARRRRGRTGERTLVDTASMRNSLTYVVKDK
jgi:phage gpG-like protein